MKEIIIAFIVGFVPNFLFAFGTGNAIKAKTPWPTWAFIAGGFIAYSIGLFWHRR